MPGMKKNYDRTWRPASKASEGPRKTMPKKASGPKGPMMKKTMPKRGK